MVIQEMAPASAAMAAMVEVVYIAVGVVVGILAGRIVNAVRRHMRSLSPRPLLDRSEMDDLRRRAERVARESGVSEEERREMFLDGYAEAYSRESERQR